MTTGFRFFARPGLFARSGREPSSHALYSMLPFVMAFWWVFGGSHQTKVTMNGSQYAPTAMGTVLVSHDSNNNTDVEIKVKYLAHPGQLTPPAVEYVVWIQANGRQPENQGNLHVGKNLDGDFKTVTPYKDFKVLITAQDSPQAQMPDGHEVLTATVSQ